MSSTKNKPLLLLKKGLKFIFYSVLGIFVLLNLLILLSGKTYIYKGILSTYLVGETGPSIYDLDKFAFRKVKKGAANSNWIDHSKEYKIALSDEFENYQLENATKAFLVMKGNEIIFEKYWGDHTQKTVSNSFSASKTIVALLIGIAVEEGHIKSIDDSVGDYLPEFKGGDKGIITIRDLLYMASGLDWTESGKNPLSNNAESYYGTDLYGLVTRQKRIATPGETFIYQSGNSQILGFIIQKATGKTVSDYCAEKIWSKIGATSDAFWSLDKENGDEKAFCCMYATARDFGRIGQLIMKRGKIGTQQIVPEWYIEEMFQLPKHIKTEEGIENHQYGLHIWLYEGYTSPVQYCRGIKGQYIISIPEEDLVIVRLGDYRKPNYELPKDKKDLKKQLPFIGHPTDLQEYINFATQITAQIKK